MRHIHFIVVHVGQADKATSLKHTTEKGEDPAMHYHLSTKGNFTALRPVYKNSLLGERSGNQCICIGVEDAQGKANSKNTMTRSQEEVLFDKLVQLTERYPKAQIVGKDYFDGKPYPSHQFDVREWLSTYVPDLLMAA